MTDTKCGMLSVILNIGFHSEILAAFEFSAGAVLLIEV